MTRLCANVLVALAVGEFVARLNAAESIVDLRIDFAKANGVLRPLHGINKGPLAPGGLIDLSDPLRALQPPFVRLHDCHWPNPDVVDIHAVFRNFDGDTEEPSSFDFALTDEYIAATRRTGAEIVYRLGESIEHTSTRHFVHPPRDFDKWARICLGIIRHYNDGWANGHHYGIGYWEIWNEPENRPAMWNGSDEDYFRLYRVAAAEIKKRYPQLKVGGPAVGYSGQFVSGIFQPGAFVTNFLSFCRRESLPLDFFSWHCYSADPVEPALRARAVRRLLNQYGFTKTESHLNEWNYLPGNSWKPLSRSSPPEARQQFYEEMAGARGAAFLANALIELQDAPVDVCNIFHGESGGFGLFNEYGVPQKNYYALLAFKAAVLETPRRIETSSSRAGDVGSIAGLSATADAASILISNFAASQSGFHVALTNLPWTGPTMLETHRITRTDNFQRSLRQTNSATFFIFKTELESPGVAFIRLRPASHQ